MKQTMKKNLAILLVFAMLFSLVPITAFAAETYYTITAVSEDTNKGTVTGGGTYSSNTNANLEAFPKEGYVLEGWYKDGVWKNASPKYSPMVRGDAIYTAKFKKADGIITAANAVIDAPTAGAHPDMTPEVPEADKDKYTVTFYKWYNCSNNEMRASDTFEGGKEYELRVVFEAKEGYKFDGSVAFTVNDKNTEVFTDDNPYSVTKRKIKFQVPTADNYLVTINGGKFNVSGGTSSGNCSPGSIVGIVANEPESGKRFKEWTATDGVSFVDATAAETSFTMPAKPVTITATYEDIPAVTYTVSFDAGGGTGTMADVTGVSGEYTLPANEFTAPAGMQFKAWSVGGVEKAAHSEINVTANTTITALWVVGHIHSYATAWTTDATYHWHKATCCDYPGAIADKGEHTYGADNICDTCGYTRPSSDEGTAAPSGSSSGGGFSGSYNYPVNADKVTGADVTLSDEHATAGETVTITVKPEAGKKVDEVIVTDADGDVIPVTKAGDHQYTFTMPAGKVNVEVTTEDAAYSQRIVMQIDNNNIVNNNKTITNDVAPVIVGDRTLVPIRVVTELLGGSAHWDNATRTVTLKIDGKTMNMTIGKPIPGFGTSAVIMNDRTYVPVRYVMEKLGAEVEWIGATQQIIIEK